LDAVLYEIEQLLKASGIQTNNPWHNNALLESTLVHVRVLLDFFENSSRSIRRKGNNQLELDDVLAQDYGFPAHRISISSDDRERLNKDLAHLTYSRILRGPQDKQWQYKEVVGPVLERCEEFLAHLEVNYVYPNRSDIVQQCSRLLNQVQSRLQAYQ
jgi:hypothetical protein